MVPETNVWSAADLALLAVFFLAVLGLAVAAALTAAVFLAATAFAAAAVLPTAVTVARTLAAFGVGDVVHCQVLPINVQA
jgi:predicted membrane-bound spermidine synthase